MFKNFSLTIAGAFVTIAGTLLIKFGFSESCSNEIVKLLPALAGGVMSWYGRYRQGGVSALGVKKY